MTFTLSLGLFCMHNFPGDFDIMQAAENTNVLNGIQFLFIHSSLSLSQSFSLTFFLNCDMCTEKCISVYAEKNDPISLKRILTKSIFLLYSPPPKLKFCNNHITSCKWITHSSF